MGHKVFWKSHHKVINSNQTLKFTTSYKTNQYDVNSVSKVTTHNINAALWENRRQLFYLRSLHERLVDDAITKFSNLNLQTSQSNIAAGDLILVAHSLNIFIFEYKIQHTLVNF
jgi:hypothetical protein